MKQMYYDENDVFKLIDEVCKTNHIDLQYWRNDEIKEDYHNDVAWSDNEIIVGPFDNLELKLLYFFEAFAGLKLSQQVPGKVAGYTSNDTSDEQYHLWLMMLGIGWAYLHYGIVFSDDVINNSWNEKSKWITIQNTRVKAVEGDKDHYVIERTWSPLENYRLVMIMKSQTDFNRKKQQLSDLAHEMHIDCEKDVENEFRAFIPIDVNNEELMREVSHFASLAVKLDGDVFFEMQKSDISEYVGNIEVNSDIRCYPDNSIKTASKKYPFSPCIIGYSGRPVGGVDDEVLKAFENSFKQVKSMAKDKDISALERALNVSKSKYSASYLNMLCSANTWLFPSGSPERKKMTDMYEDLLKICQDNKRYENAVEIVKRAFSQAGFKLVDDKYSWGGYPQMVFTKNGIYYYVDSDKQSIFWLFRQGTHKFNAQWNDDMKNSTHRVKEIGGGLENLLKTFRALKTASIARKICLAYTKKSLLEFLRYKLSTDDKWALRALQRIYQGQTVEQLNTQETRELNNLGFTGFDAPILTSIYKSYLEHHNRLTPKQMQTVKNMMKKYAGQIYRSNYFDKAKMEKIYEQHLRDNLF